MQNKIQNLIWAIRAFYGVTPESKNKDFFSKKTKKIIPNYLKENPKIKKLNIGAQVQTLEGWLSVDIWPAKEGIAYMDATKKFPFEDETFDYIFTEHMIEHISFNDAQFMLKECHRVLKKNGKIRIATPSLLKIISNFDNNKELSKIYFSKLINPLLNLQNDITPKKGYFINYITYNYNHKFIYDEGTLSDLLLISNFNNINFFNPGKSEDNNLKDLEIHQFYLGEEINNFETMVLEAEKK
jgi:SAM-dependent methyltransferase